MILYNYSVNFYSPHSRHALAVRCNIMTVSSADYCVYLRQVLTCMVSVRLLMVRRLQGMQDDIDLVATDVLACLMLLGQEQSHHCSHKAIRKSGESSPSSRPSWMTVHKARHYMRYALAAFGWPMYILPSQQLTQSMWRIYHVSRYINHHQLAKADLIHRWELFWMFSAIIPDIP